MASSLGGKSLSYGAKKNSRKQDVFVRVRKSDLEKLTTEVMQLREFLPRVLNRDLIEMLHKARRAQTSRLEAGQTECQKEREEKLLLREQLWQGGAELQQQADFCSALGSAACSLLWSCSSREDTVTRWLADTLESFVRSLDEEEKTQTEDHNSHEHQFVLALAGTITNIAAVTCGRDFLSTSAQDLLDTLMKMLELMKPGVFPKLKVYMELCISVRGLKCISENTGLLPLICTLLDDGDWEVCLHSVRLLQSVLLEEEVLLLLGPPLLDPRLQAAVSRLTSSLQPGLRLAAKQTLEDLQTLQQSRGGKQSSIFNPPAV
ncbi:Heat shock factor 2-binding protein [Dissostichus eleginoides]|uniref:Heat shock factor 2-binding protein n=1 Tax=Dissostichus eleginoides TaxID=100907 RepID=A0AAD9B5L3_DISEL|nr:Heat shock factor 2-binding protein [Dissostichus eleginoides]